MQSGARFVMPSAQHHDNFAMWAGEVTPFNAKQLGPHRDLIGELAAAVRRAGLRPALAHYAKD